MPLISLGQVRHDYPELSEVEVQRVLECDALAFRITGSHATRFVICNEQVSEETRWASLWFALESGGIMEFFGFLRRSSFDWVPSGTGAFRIEWEFEDYDFAAATAASRMTVSGSLSPSGATALSFSMTAVGLNCDRVSRFVKETFQPH